MAIRKATLKDLDSIVLLWQEMMSLHESLDAYFILKKKADWSYRSYMKHNIETKEQTVFLYEEKGTAAGYIAIQIEEYPPVYEEKIFAGINELAVTASLRRRGIGRALFNAALDWIKERGITRVEVKMASSNSPACGFYEKMGFRPVIVSGLLEL